MEPKKEIDLDDEERFELTELSSSALKHISLKGTTPQDIVYAIRYFVDDVLEQDWAEDKIEDISYDLGALWGTQLCQGLNWQWVHLYDSDDSDGYAVVSPDRSYVYYPMHLIYRILKKDRPNNLALIFNMLREKTGIPESSPNSYMIPFT